MENDNMQKLSTKEKIFYSLICNEKRVYKHWYRRFINAGVDLGRIRRVIGRIENWYRWCEEWSKEGEHLERLAQQARSDNSLYSARQFYHQAAGCFHIGQHFFYIDPDQKRKAEVKLRQNYKNAVDLYPENQRPIRVDIPFEETFIPGYLRLTKQPNSPLVIFINGMDNLKEIELHHYGTMYTSAGFNTLAFDGPGQGEMWEAMKLIPDYEKVVSTIIDWLGENDKYHLNLSKIGTVGWSLGGYLAPRAAAFDQRICCAIGSGGPAFDDFLKNKNKVNPLLLKGIPHLAGAETYEEALKMIDFNINSAPPMDRPLLIFQSGADRLIPDGREHARVFLDWAIGEKESIFYPDGDHVCSNYLDETDGHMIDWLRKNLMALDLMEDSNNWESAYSNEFINE